MRWLVPRGERFANFDILNDGDTQLDCYRQFVLFEIYRRYRLRLAPGATVTKNTVVTTKPATVPVIRRPRDPVGYRQEQVGDARI